MPFELTDGKLRKEDLPKLVAAFHQMHERIYTIKDEADVVEFTTWKVRAMGDTGGAGRRGSKLAPQQGTPQPKSRRSVYLGKAGLQTVPIYEGAQSRRRREGRTARRHRAADHHHPAAAKQTAVADDHGNFLVETA